MSRELSDIIIVAIGALTLFVAMPWLFLHFATRWRQQDDVNEAHRKLLEELSERARRLDDRATTLERIAAPDEIDLETPGQDRDLGRKK